MFTRFPLKCVTVVGVDYVLRFNWKIIVVIARFIYYDHVVFKRKFAIVFVEWFLCEGWRVNWEILAKRDR